jgi:hypothetical protein
LKEKAASDTNVWKYVRSLNGDYDQRYLLKRLWWSIEQLEGAAVEDKSRRNWAVRGRDDACSSMLWIGAIVVGARDKVVSELNIVGGW